MKSLFAVADGDDVVKEERSLTQRSCAASDGTLSFRHLLLDSMMT